MMARSKLAIFSLMFVGALCAAPVPDDADLRYKFKEGDKLGYELEQKVKMEMSIGGQDIIVDMDMTMTCTWKIDSVDKDGKAKMTQTISRIQLKMTHPQGQFEYDSKDGKEPDDPVATKTLGPIKALVDADVGMTMDARGKIGDVKIPDSVKDAWKKAGNAQGLGDLGSADGIKKLVEMSGVVLPEGSIAKGKSWDSKSEIAMDKGLGKMIQETKHTYDGEEKHDGKNLQKISSVITQSIEPGKDAPEIKVKSQDSKGTTYFDKDAGRVTETNMTQNIVMEINAGGQTLTEKITQTIKLKLADSK
jgi:hypothetical protein